MPMGEKTLSALVCPHLQNASSNRKTIGYIIGYARYAFNDNVIGKLAIVLMGPEIVEGISLDLTHEPRKQSSNCLDSGTGLVQDPNLVG